MYGPYFYNATIRKVVALFGDMFNEINVARQDAAGNLINQKQVPLSYAPQQSFLARLAERPDLESDRVAISLPRMSYQISGNLIYDSNRQIPKSNMCVVLNADGNPVGVMSPAPYNIPFELSVYAVNQNEALQVVEQILPYFKPSITRRYRPFDGQTWTDEVTFILQNVSIEDTFENDFIENRAVIYTLQFDARINIYGYVDNNSSIIKNAIVNFTTTPGQIPDLTIQQSVNPQEANEDDVHTIDITRTYGFE